jgi:hypothetical protein
MLINEAIKVCKEMQKWRRGEYPYDGEDPETHQTMPYNPKEFGEAIDKLIRFAEQTLQARVFIDKLKEIAKK